MNDHPLGTPAGDETPDPHIAEPSIVDQILDLDKLLSAEVRLAEKTARFCTRPDLEADIDELEAELAMLVDARGNPLDEDEALAGERTARVVALEIRDKQREYAAAFRSVRMRQLPEDQWKPFYEKHRADLEQGEHKDEMFAELIVLSALKPKISAEQLAGLRSKVGHAAVDELATKAWVVNTQSGVSVPKSLISSAVLKRLARG